MTDLPVAMPRQHERTRGRWLVPWIEVMLLVTAAALVLGTAVAVSNSAAQKVEAAAEDQTIIATEAMISAYLHPLLSMSQLTSVSSATAAEINRELELLVGSGKILRIKIWTPSGMVAYSDLAVLRGKTFEVDDELTDALAGEPRSGISPANAPENLYERNLAPQLLSIYLPIAPHPGERPIGAYEVYLDASALLGTIDETRRSVFLITGIFGAVLLLVLYATVRTGNRLIGGMAGRLQSSEERFRSLVQSSADLIVMLSADGTVMYLSPAIERIVGRPAEAWIGRPGDEALREVVHKDDVSWVNALMERLLTADGPISGGSVRVAHADGRWRWLELIGTNLLADPAVGAIVLNCRDVTDRRSLEDQLAYQASHDPLTKLANRSLFTTRVQDELGAPRTNGRRQLAVLMLDLDNFKAVNDTVGQVVGDQLLIAFAERLRTAIRRTDSAACFGGDKFALLVTRKGQAEIDQIVEQVMSLAATPIAVAGHQLSVSISLGVALANGVDTSAEQLLSGADVAMHLAKNTGRARSVVFEPGMHATAVRLLNMRSDLARALEDRQLTIRYQPLVELATSEPVGVEALLRWEHPNGLIMPAEFIPVAEETGLIVPIGCWALEEACRALAELDRQVPGRPLRLSVNVSTAQLARHEFVDEVQDALRATGFDATRLTLELTESLLIDRSGPAIGVMRRLRELGVRLAIDDFGIGYSALSYLRDMPLDSLKIDRSFVAGLEHDGEAPAVVRSIINLAGTLGLLVVAEGIENAEQLTRLRALGTQYGQGFYFAEPLTGDELLDYLSGAPTSIALAAS